MSPKRFALLAGLVAAVGCSSPAPSPPVVAAPARAPEADPPKAPEAEKPVVALIEPYLVAVAPQRLVLPPSSLGGRVRPGRIFPGPTMEPLMPPPATETRPIEPPIQNSPTTPRSKDPLPAMIRLMEEERARGVDAARKRHLAAAARVTQTTSEAKKTADLVRMGALAQFKADQAEAAVREATGEQTEAQKALDEALQRQRDTRRDVEAALKASAEVANPILLAQVPVSPTAFQPVPYTYRLSILGSDPVSIRVESGTLGRALEKEPGEAGAWILRCVDPSRVRIWVGLQKVLPVVRSLPPATPAKPRV